MLRVLQVTTVHVMYFHLTRRMLQVYIHKLWLLQNLMTTLTVVFNMNWIPFQDWTAYEEITDPEEKGSC